LATSGSKSYSRGNGLAWYPVTPKMGRIQFQGEECSKEIKRRSILSMLSPPNKKRSEMSDKVADTHANIIVDDKGDPKVHLKREFDSEDEDSQAQAHVDDNLNKTQVKEQEAVATKRQKANFE